MDFFQEENKLLCPERGRKNKEQTNKQAEEQQVAQLADRKRQLPDRRPHPFHLGVENGTGKSRPDRLRLPFKPTVNYFREKNGKMGKQNGKTGGNGNGNGWGVFPTVFTVPVFSRENSRGNSRICRSRLCYLCWKRDLLFARVPT